MPNGDGKLGPPTLSIGTLSTSGQSWPRNLIRDNVDVAFERRVHKIDRGDPISQLVPSAGAGTSAELDTAIAVSPFPSRVRLRLTVRDFVNTTGKNAITELTLGDTVTIKLESGQDQGVYSVFKTYTIRGTTKGGEGLDVEIPMPNLLDRFVRVVVERTDTVNETGPEIRLQGIYEGQQVRKITSLVGHIDGSSRSATSTAFQTFQDQNFITDPVFYVPRAEGDGMVAFIYPGDFEVDRVMVADNHDRSCRVRVAVTGSTEYEDTEIT